MDYYSYFRERFTWGSNPYMAMADCQQIVGELLDNPKIPFQISAAAAADLLAALVDYAGNGCTVTATYENIMKALIDVCQRMKDTTAATDRAWLLETQELGQEASGGGPLYGPGDYEVWPVDMDTGEDEVDGEDPDEDEPREPNGMLEAIEEALCSRCDFVAPETRRPWPDWEHCANWTSGDWVRFQVHREKILAAAKLHDCSAVGTVTDAIATASAHMSVLPLPRRAEVTLWCQELMDELYATLQKSCAGTPYTPTDRACPKIDPI